MASLTPASAQAIARLRAYVPPPSQYSNLPLSRRAAVLILLYPDRTGELRVVLTMRAGSLRSYAGHAALPGGKADCLSESAFQTARREAWEEIGLPVNDAKLPAPFTIEHLCQLPTNLAKTELGVRPCVAFLSAKQSSSAGGDSAQQAGNRSIPSVEEMLIPRLDAKEVAAVFTAPFRNFLRTTVDYSSADAENAPGIEAAGFPAEWYRGVWTDWHESKWRMHKFYVPVSPKTVARPKGLDPSTDSLAGLSQYRVFGMTARILVDAARVAYAEEPEFEHNAHFGDEDMISRLMKMGRMSEIRKPGDELTKEILRDAAKM